MVVTIFYWLDQFAKIYHHKHSFFPLSYCTGRFWVTENCLRTIRVNLYSFCVHVSLTELYLCFAWCCYWNVYQILILCINNCQMFEIYILFRNDAQPGTKQFSISKHGDTLLCQRWFWFASYFIQITIINTIYDICIYNPFSLQNGNIDEYSVQQPITEWPHFF